MAAKEISVKRYVVRLSVDERAKANRAFDSVAWDDAVVSGVARGHIDHNASAHLMVVAAGEQSGPRRRAERRRMEGGVAQAHLRNAVERRSRDYAAECARSG